MSDHKTTCEVCEKVAPTRSHPCRFERACSCWYGVPCVPGVKALRAYATPTKEASR